MAAKKTSPLSSATTPVARSEAKGSGTASASKPVSSPIAGTGTKLPTYEQIATKAYEIYLKRGYGPGDALSDWAEAERQLKTGR